MQIGYLQAKDLPGYDNSVYSWGNEGDVDENDELEWKSFAPSTYFNSPYFVEIPY